MCYNEIESSLRDFPTSNLIYSSFSAFADVAGGEIPGAWFVLALLELGHTESSIRQNLFRMTGSGELIARKVGRRNYYRPGPYMEREIAAGRARLTDSSGDAWDGEWTLVNYSTSTNDRNARERIRSILEVYGFASMANGMFVHPRDHSAAICDLIRETDLSEMVRVFRARLVSDAKTSEMIARLWDLEAIASGYKNFLKAVESVKERLAKASNLQAFQLRYFVALEYLHIAWQDPDLPLDLLPPRWPGQAAKCEAQTLYKKLLDPATAHFEEVLSSLNHAHAS